jgi:hypothetical protein
MIYIYLRSEVLTVIYIKIMVPWDEMVCSLVDRCHLFPTVKMEGAYLSETLKTAFHTLQHHIPEDCYLNTFSLENYNSSVATSHDVPTLR